MDDVLGDVVVVFEDGEVVVGGAIDGVDMGAEVVVGLAEAVTKLGSAPAIVVSRLEHSGRKNHDATEAHCKKKYNFDTPAAAETF